MIRAMPLVSQFFGIKIHMYWENHLPAHFHAICGEREVLVDIEAGSVIRSVFPGNKLKLILA